MNIKSFLIKMVLKGKEILCNERGDGGGGILIGIIFSAILILAVVVLKDPIITFFSSALSSFTTWALSKLTTLFS